MVIRFVFFVVLLMAVFVWTKEAIVTGKAINLINDHPHPVWTPRALYWLGNFYYLIGNNKKAVICLEIIVNKYPKSGRTEDAEYLLGVCYEKTDLPKSIAWYKKLLEDYPKTKRREMVEKDIYFLQQ
ncbi:MAG: tetratricopeptide repeat protein [Elusimicrobiota bacterium]